MTYSISDSIDGIDGIADTANGGSITLTDGTHSLDLGYFGFGLADGSDLLLTLINCYDSQSISSSLKAKLAAATSGGLGGTGSLGSIIGTPLSPLDTIEKMIGVDVGGATKTNLVDKLGNSSVATSISSLLGSPSGTATDSIYTRIGAVKSLASSSVAGDLTSIIGASGSDLYSRLTGSSGLSASLDGTQGSTPLVTSLSAKIAAQTQAVQSTATQLNTAISAVSALLGSGLSSSTDLYNLVMGASEELDGATSSNVAAKIQALATALDGTTTPPGKISGATGSAFSLVSYNGTTNQTFGGAQATNPTATTVQISIGGENYSYTASGSSTTGALTFTGTSSNTLVLTASGTYNGGTASANATAIASALNAYLATGAYISSSLKAKIANFDTSGSGDSIEDGALTVYGAINTVENLLGSSGALATRAMNVQGLLGSDPSMTSSTDLYGILNDANSGSSSGLIAKLNGTGSTTILGGVNALAGSIDGSASVTGSSSSNLSANLLAQTQLVNADLLN